MTAPTPQQISEAIRKHRTMFIREGLAPSYFEINNGQCIDFAEEVLRILEKSFGESATLFTVEGANFYRSQDDELWDGRLLRNYWKMAPPEHFTWPILNTIAFGIHIWITCERRHYDAECPDGVDNFFDLPIFRRSLVEHLREQGIDCPDVETDDVVPAPRCPVVIS